MSTPLDAKTLEAAAQWYVELCDGDEQAREAHRQWLQSDPRHGLAWARVERLQSTLGRVSADIARPTLDASRLKRRATLKVLALLICVGGVAGLGVQVTPWRNALADYRTGTGERRQVRLADGSSLQLNTGSAVDVRFGDTLREVRLREGEILIQTAADALARPFVVHTPHGSIRALGTRFLVRSDGAQTRVGVLQHAVEVRPALTPERPSRIDAGQQLVFSRRASGPLKRLPKGSDAWTHDQLVVSNWRLDDFLAELARYRSGHLGCDSRVAGLRISGAFQLRDTDSVLDNLGGTLPVRVRRLTRYWVQVERA
ncbi:FecR domain-containing protein [Phytopseudomonas dryadis]|uniref:Iron dicitrate transport regulator FecR n=1 Tax=Phytopseudomonas dryadis TaxID=2487520 RepID=A0A4Q9QUM5_9GAMM|nr:FecR domain-containing protein [Pseudomonas dryadis]TBU85614.1 iron dicitrate transport regulator FecR [Pseudomonas dryadis]